MDDPRTEGGASAGAGLYPGRKAGFGCPIYPLAGKHYENTIKKNTSKYYENIIKHVFVVNLRPVVDVIGAVVVRMWMILDVFTVRLKYHPLILDSSLEQCHDYKVRRATLIYWG